MFKEFFVAKELFSVVDLAPYFVDFWGQMGQDAVQETGGDGVAEVSVPRIGGRIRLVQDYDDTRMSVRIDYDAGFEGDVEPFVAFLSDMGFVQAGQV